MLAAVTFDLFDTVVDLHMEDLPEFDVGGKRLRGTHAFLHALVAEYSDVDLPNHVELLRDLARELRAGICSNFSHTQTAVRVVADAGLEPHVHATVVSEEVGIRKPRPEIFEATLQRLGVAAEQTLHVGDRLGADVRGAAEAGLRTAWITRRVRDPEKTLRDHDGPAPNYVIADLDELRAIVGLV